MGKNVNSGILIPDKLAMQLKKFYDFRMKASLKNYVHRRAADFLSELEKDFFKISASTDLNKYKSELLEYTKFVDELFDFAVEIKAVKRNFTKEVYNKYDTPVPTLLSKISKKLSDELLNIVTES